VRALIDHYDDPLAVANFQKIYPALVNSWALYDNPGAKLRLIMAGDNQWVRT
jgi:hypothetical protein